MLDRLTEWAVVGPVAIVALAAALGFFRRYVLRKKAERAKTENEVRDPRDEFDNWSERDWADAVAAEKAAAAITAPPPSPFEDDYAKRRQLARERKDVTSKAYQEAQYRAVELNEPVILVFHDPREVKEGHMLYSTTSCPHDDPRRKGIEGRVEGDKDTLADVIVIDNRPLGHEMIDETREVMPATEREKHEELTARREAAIREASSPAFQALIDFNKLYKQGIDQKAAQEFEEALPAIRTEAEMKAALMAEAPTRHALLLAEAQERGIGYPEVLAEFVSMVADLAVKEAKKRFQRGNSTSDTPITQSFGQAVLAGGWKY